MTRPLILAAIAAYFTLIVGISLLISKRRRSSEDFFRGGRKSPWWAVAIAMVGTSMSGVSFVSVPGMVQASQFAYLQMALGFIAGYAVIAFVLLPLYYKLDLRSLYGYLEQRFGACTYKTGAWFFLLAKLLGAGVKMYLTAVVLQLVLFEPLGISFTINVAATVLVVWLYTFRGGVRSLVWTDMLQTLALVGAVMLSIVFIGHAMGLSIGGVATKVASDPLSRIWFFDDFRDTRFFWKQFLAGMFTTIAMTGLDQDMMQKNLSCKTLRQSQRNVLSYGVAFVPVNLLFLSLGVLLYAFAAQNSIGVAKADDLFPTIACGIDPSTGNAWMPGIVSFLFVFGIVSASFSSAGSALTALTTTFTLDVLKADRRMEERQLLRTRSRVHVAVAVLMCGVILAFRAIGNGSAIDMVYTLVGYTYGPLLGLFAFGIFTKRRIRDRWAPAICIAAPTVSFILAQNSAAWFGGYRIGFELLLINAALTLLGLWLSSMRQPSGPARATDRRTGRRGGFRQGLGGKCD